MGLLDFLRRKTPSPVEETAGRATPSGSPEPAGQVAEGPPTGVSDPGSLTGEDVARAAEDERGADKPAP